MGWVEIRGELPEHVPTGKKEARANLCLWLSQVTVGYSR
jgi:hypothetical protein